MKVRERLGVILSRSFWRAAGRLALASAMVLHSWLPWGTTLVWAQVPSLFNFQGRLTDPLGNPLTGSKTVIFRVYDASAGGALLWSETQAAVAVFNGLLNVQLGSVTPLTQAAFSGATTYLEITVDGVTLSPRERMAAVPYALNARYWDGREASSFVSTSAAQTVGGDKTFTGTIVVAR